MDRRRFLETGALFAAWQQTRRARAFDGFGMQGPAEETEQSSAVSAGRLSQDPLRPQFHLLPAANWMNDPCAPRFYSGEYHMFFQYNPHAAVWGDMHWAHAVSPDLVHWKHRSIAIAPTPDGPDRYGVFTGSVFPGVDKPTIVYTGVTKVELGKGPIPTSDINEVQMMATADGPSLDHWTKLEEPVVPKHPEGLDLTGFRDPCPWREGDTWYMGIGSGFRRKGGAVLLYRSKDGRQWEYLHPLAEGKWNGTTHPDPVDSGEMWECPDFFPLNDRHVLLYSSERKVYWQVGRWDRKTLRFRAQKQGLLDMGAYYAPKSMLDKRGRRILWGWIPEKRPVPAYSKAGWAGMMALPRVLSISPDGRLLMEPIGELSVLLRPATADGVAGSADDKTAESAAAKSATWTLKQRQGRLTLHLQPAAGPWDLRVSVPGEAHGAEPLLRVSADPQLPKTLLVAGKRLTLRPDASGSSVLDVWLDGSVAEIFADRSAVVTERFYSRPQEALRLTWTGSDGAITKAELFEVRAISRDRLTT